MAAIDLFLFGSPHIVYQGRSIEVTRRKSLALVAYLALADRSQSRDVLATLLWPDLDQERARTALRSTLLTLSSLVPQSWLAADRQTIRLKQEEVWVDTRQFLALLGAKPHASAPGRHIVPGMP
jgi:DNA-binding SARP family transcriptional activator